MQESTFTNYDQLPLFLNANTVAQVLGVSISSAYELMQRDGLPRAADRQPHRGTQRRVPPVGRCADRG